MHDGDDSDGMNDGAGGGGRRGSRRERRVPPPLDGAALEQLALAYLARFSTSTGKLTDYLRRKLAGRGWADGDEDGAVEAGRAAIERIVARAVAAGYLDDAGFARARADTLGRRGYGHRRIAEVLAVAGIAGDEVRAVLPGEHAARMAALALARRRRFGPFGAGPAGEDRMAARARCERQVAAMLRAGHPLDSARELVNARTIEAAEQWVAAAGEDGECER